MYVLPCVIHVHVRMLNIIKAAYLLKTVRCTWIICMGVDLVAVWCSCNALVSINAVALHRARLVQGWVTCLWVGKLSHYVTSHSGQLSLAIPPWVGAMSTGDGYGHR